MKKTLLSMLLLLSALIVTAQKQKLYEFKVNTLDGTPFDLKSLEGKKVLIVNTASKCGYTPQYEDLEKLYKKYGSEKFVILGFPSNDFMRQEPGSNSDIKAFCTKNYGVTFPMMEKISVKGKEIAPIYRWLTSKELNGHEDYTVGWNFNKFLIDEYGNVEGHFGSSTKPDAEEIINWLTR
jgi:glutathione peroxidase